MSAEGQPTCTREASQKKGHAGARRKARTIEDTNANPKYRAPTARSYSWRLLCTSRINNSASPRDPFAAKRKQWVGTMATSPKRPEDETRRDAVVEHQAHDRAGDDGEERIGEGLGRVCHQQEINEKIRGRAEAVADQEGEPLAQQAACRRPVAEGECAVAPPGEGDGDEERRKPAAIFVEPQEMQRQVKRKPVHQEAAAADQCEAQEADFVDAFRAFRQRLHGSSRSWGPAIRR